MQRSLQRRTYYHAATVPQTQWAYANLDGALQHLLKNTGLSLAGSDDKDITPVVFFGRLAAKFNEDPMGTLAAAAESFREVTLRARAVVTRVRYTRAVR